MNPIYSGCGMLRLAIHQELVISGLYIDRKGRIIYPFALLNFSPGEALSGRYVIYLTPLLAEETRTDI
jgi:hypothetical protein